jgi:preprotein translocase subunit SecD
MHSAIISSTPVLSFKVSDPVSFGRFTAAHVNQDLGIFIDDRLIAAPRLTGPIPDGGEIAGGKDNTMQELGFIAAIMNLGSLPTHLRYVSSSGIIPGKGRDDEDSMAYLSGERYRGGSVAFGLWRIAAADRRADYFISC